MPRDIIDHPGPLPDEEPKDVEKPEEKSWLLPEEVRGFAWAYDVTIMGCEDEPHGATVTVLSKEWGRVCQLARKYGNLSRVSVRSSAGLVLAEADVVPDASTYRILVKSTVYPTESVDILNLTDLL